MNLQKRNLLITIFVVIILNILIYTNNKQRTSFRYFIWNTQTISLGKVINISFVSGLLISTILNNYIITKGLTNKAIVEESEEDRENTTINNNYADEMPPERDIRDSQPTISVNYRVVKSNEENYESYTNTPSDKSKYDDDWSETNSEW